MDKIMEAIEEWFFELLRGFCMTNINGMFDSINQKVSSISTEVGKTPQGWNSGVFGMIQNISDNVILPIAGMILTAVLCYEFINLIVEKNNMHEVPIESFAKIFIKMGISIYLLSHTFEIVMAIFDVAQHIVSRASGLINSNGTLTTGGVEETINNMTDIPQLISIALLAGGLRFVMHGMSIAIMIILYGRMMQIYMYTSAAPIPFATFGNKEWGSIGTNYVKAVSALALQGFFILICVSIYSALVQSLNTSSDVQEALLEMVAYTVLLVISLFQTHKVSQSVLNAH